MSFRTIASPQKVNLELDKTISELIDKKQWLAAYNLAIQIEEKSVATCFNLALCLYRIEMYEEAETWLKKALFLNEHALDTSHLHFNDIEAALLRYENRDYTYYASLNPDFKMSQAWISMKIQLVLLDVYVALHNTTRIQEIVSKYEYLKLESVTRAKEILKSE